MPLRFDDRVVVITGAGGGLGRAYALLFASLGAKVVVNDLGGNLSGEGGTSGRRAADVVVEEILHQGGNAVANYDSVENGEKIITTAIKSYGKIDVLINNAGILRDRSFSKMTEQDWDLIMLVHLKGSFACTKAAWPHMMKQNYGRIVNTASAAGLYGNFGQANYSAAKLALVGFSKSLAAEGAKKNIHCNVIVPLAGTRMTETILPQQVVDALRPEYIAPVVAYLCHDTCSDNAEVMECGAGWIAKVRWQRAKGVKHNPVSGFTVDDVQRKWSLVGDYAHEVTYPTTMQESLMMVTQSLTSNKEKGDNASSTSTESAYEKIFQLMNAYLRVKGADTVAKVGSKFGWNVIKEKGGPVIDSWIIDLKNSPGSVLKSENNADVDATFTMTQEDTVKVCLGLLNPQIAFIQGMMKIKGNMAAATKFTPNLFPKIDSSILNLSIKEAINNYLNMGNEVINGTGLKSENILKMIQEYLSTNDGNKLINRIGCVYQLDIVPKPGAQPIGFILEIKSDPPKLLRGNTDKYDAKFTLLDLDFIELSKGKLDPQKAFIEDKIKITGNIRSAMKFFIPELFPKILSNL